MSQDPHLNLFFAYGQGRRGSVDSEKNLEDNVTRALTNVLQYSEPSLTNRFLSEMLGVVIPASREQPLFDLQSLGSLSPIRERLKKGCRPFVLGISPSDKAPEKTDKEAEKILTAMEQTASSPALSTLRTALRKVIDKALKEEDTLTPADQSAITTEIERTLGVRAEPQALSRDCLQALYELAQGSRPDGWIACGDVVVLLENKIRGDLYRAQIERHKKYSLKARGRVEERFNSWKEVYEFFNREAEKNSEARTCFLIEQFTHYLEMLDMVGFQGIPFGPGGVTYGREKGKNVLRNLVAEIASKVQELDPSLVRDKKTKGIEWDYFGTTDLHFTVYVREEWAGLDLFCDSGKFVRAFKGGDEGLKNHLEQLLEKEQLKRAKTPLSRYWIYADSYRLLDHTKGMMKGSFYQSQVYCANLDDLRKLGPEVQQKALRFFLDMVRYCKYFRVAKQFHYASKEDRDLLKAPSFKEEIIRGIEELLPLYQLIRSLPSKGTSA